MERIKNPRKAVSAMSLTATKILTTLMLGTVFILQGALDRPSRTEEAIQKSPGPLAANSVQLDCSVYRVTDPDLLARIVAATGNVGDIKAMLQNAETGTSSLLRAHSPLKNNSELMFHATRTTPRKSVLTRSGIGGTSRQSTSKGHLRTMTRFTITCGGTDTGITTTFNLEIESIESNEMAARGTEPPTNRLGLKGRMTAPSGVTRMHRIESGTDENAAILVFVTATAF